MVMFDGIFTWSFIDREAGVADYGLVFTQNRDWPEVHLSPDSTSWREDPAEAEFKLNRKR